MSTPPDGPGSCVQAHPPVQAETLRKRRLLPGELWLLKNPPSDLKHQQRDIPDGPLVKIPFLGLPWWSSG